MHIVRQKYYNLSLKIISHTIANEHCIVSFTTHRALNTYGVTCCVSTCTSIICCNVVCYQWMQKQHHHDDVECTKTHLFWLFFKVSEIESFLSHLPKATIVNVKHTSISRFEPVIVEPHWCHSCIITFTMYINVRVELMCRLLKSYVLIL